MKKQLSLIVLSFTMISLVIAGSWGLDILINGKHLPLSRESVRKMSVEIGFALLPPDYLEKPLDERRISLDSNDPAHREKIKKAVSFLKNYRYHQRFETADQILENKEQWTNEGRILYYVEIDYQHHHESFQIFPEAIRSVNYTQGSPYALYVAKNPEKFQEQIDRFAEAVFGEKSS